MAYKVGSFFISIITCNNNAHLIKGAELVSPEFSRLERFILLNNHDAMDLDAYESSHPIRVRNSKLHLTALNRQWFLPG